MSPVINGIVDTLKPIVEGVSAAVWSALPEWIRNGLLFIGELAGQAWSTLWDFIRDPIGTIQAGLTWVTTEIGKGIDAVKTGLGAVAAGVWAALPDWVKTPILWLKDVAGAAWDTLWNFVKDPIGSIQAGLNWVATSITMAFDGALSTFGSWVTGALSAVAGALGAALQGFLTWLGEQLGWLANTIGGFLNTHVIRPLGQTFQALGEFFVEVLGTFARGALEIFSTPLGTPGPQAMDKVVEVIGRMGGFAMSMMLPILAGELIHPLKEMGLGYISAMVYDMSGFGRVAGALVSELAWSSYILPLRQAMNSLFRPAVPNPEDARPMLWRGAINMDDYMDAVGRSGYGGRWAGGYAALTAQIPGSGDLIRFVVREVINISVFNLNMAYQGYSAFWANAYWEAHWVLPAAANLVDAMHREIISRAELNTFYVLHDYKPEPRPGISKSDRAIMSGLTKTLIPRIDLRRGYATGRLSRVELDRRYKYLGYEEDAELMTDIQVALAFTTEINKLRDNAKDDFVNGFIDEPTLRADLEALGIGADLVSYHVEDAKADRERNRKKKLLTIYEDAYLKDLKNYDDLKTDAAQVVVDASALDVYLTTAYINKYKKPKTAG